MHLINQIDRISDDSGYKILTRCGRFIESRGVTENLDKVTCNLCRGTYGKKRFIVKRFKTVPFQNQFQKLFYDIEVLFNKLERKMSSSLKAGRHKENAMSRLEESFIWMEKSIKESQYGDGTIETTKATNNDGSGDKSSSE